MIVKMNLTRAKEILNTASARNNALLEVQDMVTKDEVQALAQAFIDLTAANSLLEAELEEWDDSFRE